MTQAVKELNQYGELLNMPGLEEAVETGKIRVWRRSPAALSARG